MFILANPSLANSPTPSHPQALEEVLVTALRREQALSKVPLAVNVLSADLIQRSSLQTLSEISALVPNLQVAQPNGEVLPLFSIRGISMADYSTNQSSPVGIYQDGVYLSSNFMHGLAMFDLQRVEVLKGPQGTLYGRNTTAGAINLLSNSPDFTADGYASLSLGNYNAHEFNGAYETPLIENKLAARLATNIARTDGYSENHTPGLDDLNQVDRQSYRLSLRYQANDNVEAILKLNSSRSDTNAPAVIPEATIATAAGNIDVLSATLGLFSQPFYVRPSGFDGHDANNGKNGKMAIAVDGASLALNWQLDSVNLNSTTAYYDSSYDLRADSDGTPQQLLELDYLTDSRQFSQEFSISSLETAPLGYIAGVYYHQDSVDTHVTFDYFHSLEAVLPGYAPPNTGFTQEQRYEQDRHSLAIYGQLDYQLSDALTLTAGLRYTRDRNKQYNVNTSIGNYAGVPLEGLIPLTFPYEPNAAYPSQRINDEEWTGTSKLAYQLSDEHMLYGSYSRGYRGSAFNGAAVNDASELAPVDPEYVNAYEIGAKGQWLNGQLQYRSALFYYDYRGLQFINIVGTRQLLESADRASVKGLDLELNAQITEQLSLQAGLGLIDSEFKKGINLDAGGQSWDLSGNALANAPDINANLSANYQWPIKQGQLDFYLNYQFIDDQWFTAFNDSAGYDSIGQSNYSLVDGRISFTPSSNSNIKLALWGKNLTDQEYKVYAINLSEAFGYNYTIRGAPRTYGIELSYNF
ncbi:TonB-dependent receptor [Dasania sp. GY-MA-18]|uniref:TonB-dependent receptor n=1 Tax=Dasania TaxID=503005 RepID=UPI0021AD0EEF|nr:MULTISPECIES: TonB-dependent receptor [Dasania]MCR8924197.1 TonB-dependent receptor [Dasania sp. GY-MA-18]MCZ0870355.1 TonB-dependent receptor [Dasania phycosphaerae]